MPDAGRWAGTIVLLCATILQVADPKPAFGAEPQGVWGLGPTVTESRFPASGSDLSPPLSLPGLSVKYRATSRLVLGMESGYGWTSTVLKNGEGDSDLQMGRLRGSILALSGLLYGIAASGEHCNLFVDAGPSFVRWSQKVGVETVFDGARVTSNASYSLKSYWGRMGVGLEVFPPYVPQLELSMEVGFQFGFGSFKLKGHAHMENDEGTDERTEKNEQSDLQYVGSRGGLAALGVHYYFGEPRKNRKKAVRAKR